jgi:hypothetical protein
MLEFEKPRINVYSACDKEGHPIGGKCILCNCSPTDMRIEGEVNGFLHTNCWYFVRQYSQNLQYTFGEALEQIRNRLFREEQKKEETTTKGATEMVGGC